MTHIHNLFAINDNHKPVPPYKINWLECLLVVTCASIAISVVYSGIMAIFIMWGLLPAMCAMAFLMAGIYRLAL